MEEQILQIQTMLHIGLCLPLRESKALKEIKEIKGKGLIGAEHGIILGHIILMILFFMRQTLTSVLIFVFLKVKPPFLLLTPSGIGLHNF